MCIRDSRLEELGVLGGYTILVRNPNQVQYISALISVSISPADRDEFLTLAGADSQVRQCFHVTGSHSFIVKVSCENMEQLEQLITRFQRMGPTSTQIILSTPIERGGSFI